MRYCLDLPHWSSTLGQWLYEWQTLVAGVLALLAAAVSVYFLRQQIDQSDRHERERLERQHRAVRATLPLTLAGLIEPLSAMITALHLAAIEVANNGIAKSFSPPPAPGEYVEQLQQVLATTDESTVTEPIAEIIREIQTLWSRVRTLQTEQAQRRAADLTAQIYSWIIQTSQIFVLVESLFEYARGRTQSGPKDASWAQVGTVIMRLQVEAEALHKLVNDGHSTSPSFWVIKCDR